MKYDPITRLLHVMTAAGVLSQMLTSLVMVYPKPGRMPNSWYEVHESVGIGLLAVVSLYWLWIIGRSLKRGEAMRLFPWFSRHLLGDLRDDVVETAKAVLRFRLPEAGDVQPLPAAIQGLGLILALGLAATGTTVELGMAPDGGLSPLFRAVKEIHESLAPLMWTYLVAHPLMGLLHQMAGHGSLGRMFGFR